ncbi:MAG: hypothetical protein ABIE84_02205 [bacterium]
MISIPGECGYSTSANPDCDQAYQAAYQRFVRDPQREFSLLEGLEQEADLITGAAVPTPQQSHVIFTLAAFLAQTGEEGKLGNIIKKCDLDLVVFVLEYTAAFGSPEQATAAEAATQYIFDEAYLHNSQSAQKILDRMDDQSPKRLASLVLNSANPAQAVRTLMIRAATSEKGLNTLAALLDAFWQMDDQHLDLFAKARIECQPRDDRALNSALTAMYLRISSEQSNAIDKAITALIVEPGSPAKNISPIHPLEITVVDPAVRETENYLDQFSGVVAPAVLADIRKRIMKWGGIDNIEDSALALIFETNAPSLPDPRQALPLITEAFRLAPKIGTLDHAYSIAKKAEDWAIAIETQEKLIEIFQRWQQGSQAFQPRIDQARRNIQEISRVH